MTSAFIKSIVACLISPLTCAQLLHALSFFLQKELNFITAAIGDPSGEIVGGFVGSPPPDGSNEDEGLIGVEGIEDGTIDDGEKDKDSDDDDDEDEDEEEEEEDEGATLGAGVCSSPDVCALGAEVCCSPVAVALPWLVS